MRKLMWFTLGFGGACGLGAYALSGDMLWKIALCAFLLSVLTFFFGSGGILRRAGLVLLGFAVGLTWFSLFYRLTLQKAVDMDKQIAEADFRVTDYSYETSYGSAADCVISLEGKPYRARVYLKDRALLEPGDRVSGSFRFRVTTPDGAREETYHRGEGIFLLAYQKGETTLSKGSDVSWLDSPAMLRRRIGQSLQSSFPEDTQAFARALLLGDTTGLDYETDTSLKLSGIRHVVAVSGLHISILCGMLSVVAFRKRFLRTLLGIPVLVLFAALVGFTPSVTRACVMSGLMLLALLLDKEYDAPTALSFAALLMLFLNPLTITSVGFQLSTGSVAGIFLFSSGIRQWICGWFGQAKRGKRRAAIVRWLSGSVSVTLSAQFFTVPLCAWYFGSVSLIGVVTNLLVLWMIPFLFCGIIAVCLLSLVWQAGASALALLLSLPIRLCLLIARLFAGFPLAAVYTRSPYIIAWLVFVYALVLLFLAQKNKKPAELVCCAVMGLCIALLASASEPMLDDVRLTVLDVGQGQCLLLQSEGKTFMVDCGGDSDTKAADIAAETLLSQGLTGLDGLILTHTDRDHAGAVSNLLSRIDTRLLILPPSDDAFAFASGENVICAKENLSLDFGETGITVFSSGLSDNENSLCILFDTEKCDILITGDRSGYGERMLLRDSAIRDVDVLIAGHHGSKYSTCEELLQAVRPEIVCISVGANNSYGHPAPETLERLREFGCTVYRTDQNGDILIRR